MSKLQISTKLGLPVDAVTQTFGFIARKGAGKTYAAGKLVEELHATGAPFVVMDPVGNWWGLRSAADGKKAGLPVAVFGGDHGDIPITPESGAVLARLIMDRRISAVVDVSAFRKNGRKKFVTDFAEELFQRAKSVRQPLMVVFEEAQVFAPQHAHGEERMLGAVEDIVRLGRNYGLGSALISQWPQSVNKEVLNQVEALFVGQLNGVHERRAIEAWTITKGANTKALAELPSLNVGEMFAWSPQWLGFFGKVRIGKKKTFDASSTPRLGEKRQARKLATVDIEELQRDLAETLAAAEEDDPKALRKKISEIERELAEAGTTDGAELERLQKELDTAQRLVTWFRDYVRNVGKKCQELGVEIQAFAEVPQHSVSTPDPDYSFRPKPAQEASEEPSQKPKLAVSQRSVLPNPGHEVPLAKCERFILIALLQHGTLTLEQAAIIAGYAPNSGGVRNAAGNLRTRGLIDGGNTSGLTPTTKGVAAIPDVPLLPTGPRLVEYWMGKLAKAEREILGQALLRYPKPIALTDAAKRAGYSPNSGGVRNAAEESERRKDEYEERFHSLRKDVEALITPNGLVDESDLLELLARHPMPEEKARGRR